MKNVLFIAPTARERRSLQPIADELGIHLIWDDFAGDYFDDFLQAEASSQHTLDIVALIEERISKYKNEQLAGVSSAVGYPGMSVVAILSTELGLSGPTPEAIMVCEHKYLARVRQKALVPDAVPTFSLLDPHDASTGSAITDFPVFMKPVKSCMSMNAWSIHNSDELKQRMSEALLPERFFKPFDEMVAKYTDLEMGSGYLLSEGLLCGHQVSLEGYVHDGDPVILGIVDAIMFPGTMSFKRFQYPSSLPGNVLKRMEDIARRFLIGIGYDNAMFNVELIWNPDTDEVKIIEINPKIASQFPDLFQKVDGTNTYKSLLELAIGQKPSFKHGQGKFKLAASCVLRIFEDQYVNSVPSAEHIQAVNAKYPDALVMVTAVAGKRLSELLQDTASFRYGLINIGANSQEELDTKFEDIRTMLPFHFSLMTPDNIGAVRNK